MSIQRDDIGCRVSRLRYNFDQHVGLLELPDNDCVDQTGCVDLFTGIDFDVEAIYTVNGDGRDTTYTRGKDGVWRAELAKPINDPTLRRLEATALRVLFAPERPSTREEDAQLLSTFAQVMKDAGRAAAELDKLLTACEAERPREDT